MTLCRRMQIVTTTGPLFFVDKWGRIWNPASPGPDPTSDEEMADGDDEGEFNIEDVETEEFEGGTTTGAGEGTSQFGSVQGDWDELFAGLGSPPPRPEWGTSHYEEDPAFHFHAHGHTHGTSSSSYPNYGEVLSRFDQLQLHVDGRFDAVVHDIEELREEQRNSFEKLFDFFGIGGSSSNPHGGRGTTQSAHYRSPSPHDFMPPPPPPP